jgi:hypothetical protein
MGTLLTIDVQLFKQLGPWNCIEHAFTPVLCKVVIYFDGAMKFPLGWVTLCLIVVSE